MPAASEVHYLPGLDSTEPEWLSGWYEGATVAGKAIRSPSLTADAASRVAELVREAALEARRSRTLDQVVSSVARAAGPISDPSSAAGKEAIRLLCEELGWSEPLAGETLGEMGRTWTEAELWRTLRSELPDPAVLDGFRPDAAAAVGRRRRASGSPLLFQVMAGNVPGVAVTGVVRGLLVRAGVLVKLPEDEPGLVVLFARQLAEVDPALSATVAATWWPAGVEAPLWNEWVGRASTLVVYGGDDAVAGVRSRARPDQQVVAYGPKLGVGVILPGADMPQAAGALARDICAYEQNGCVSPRLVFVLGSAEPFVKALSAALDEEVRRLPRPVPRPEEAVQIRSLRAEVEFQGYGGSASRVLESEEDLAWTVLLDDPPSLEVHPLPRVVRLSAVASLEALRTLLQPLAGRLQALGYAGDGDQLDSLADLAADLEVARVAPLGRMAWPPADWRHDGRYQLLPLLTWTDWEAE